MALLFTLTPNVNAELIKKKLSETVKFTQKNGVDTVDQISIRFNPCIYITDRYSVLFMVC